MKQFNKNNNYKYNIAILPGDGIGPEVINASLKVIKKSLKLDNIIIKEKVYNWGSNYYKKHKLMMPDDGLEKLKKHDAILIATERANLIKGNKGFAVPSNLPSIFFSSWDGFQYNLLVYLDVYQSRVRGQLLLNFHFQVCRYLCLHMLMGLDYLLVVS